jgi:hypothetical protein
MELHYTLLPPEFGEGFAVSERGYLLSQSPFYLEGVLK